MLEKYVLGDKPWKAGGYPESARPFGPVTDTTGVAIAPPRTMPVPCDER